MSFGTCVIFSLTLIQVNQVFASPTSTSTEYYCDGFECENGTCLDLDKRCDENDDCSDGEDEMFCKGYEFETSVTTSTETTSEISSQTDYTSTTILETVMSSISQEPLQEPSTIIPDISENPTTNKLEDFENSHDESTPSNVPLVLTVITIICVISFILVLSGLFVLSQICLFLDILLGNRK